MVNAFRSDTESRYILLNPRVSQSERKEEIEYLYLVDLTERHLRKCKLSEEELKGTDCGVSLKN